MRRRASILSPRRPREATRDLAERTPLIRRQRVSRRPRRRLWRRLALVVSPLALVFAAQVALLYWLLTSPSFAVTQVEVAGASHLGADEVRAAAGISPGTNLFRLDMRAIVEQVERLPWVKRADLVRSLSGRVALLIEERESFALAAGAGRLFWLDEEGRVLSPEPRAVVPGLPVITGLMRSGEEAGLTLDPKRLDDALTLLRHLLRRERWLAFQLSEIDVSRAEGPVLYTVDGIRVDLGDEDWEERLGRLGGVLVQLGESEEPVESVDLRFRGQLVLKPKAR
ncbi:MAG: cell division protein FtsQ/DivIB [Candidatus Methylomirabilia bacterium]